MKLPLVGAILLALSLSFPAFAGPPGAPPDEFIEKAEELAQWIDDNSDFGPMRRHPAYVFLPRDTLQYTYFTVAGIKYETQSHIAAVYSHGIIFLQDTFDIEDDSDAGTLLHELVHHLVELEGRGYRCVNEEEREAYDLEDLWRAQQGMTPTLDPVTYFFVTTCPQER